jgi:hypothetical protein
MTPINLSMEQMIALHGFFAEAAAVGEGRLADFSGCQTEVEVLEVRCTSLGDYGEAGMRLTEDVVAGVIGRIDGALPGSLDVVMEPEEALLWARITGSEDPIETVISLSCELLSGVTVAFSELLQSTCVLRDARLVEEPELAMLVDTHAPSDTLVFSTRLRIEARDEVVTAHSHLLVHPKSLSRLMSALSAAVH